jgi:hypothetical protein
MYTVLDGDDLPTLPMRTESSGYKLYHNCTIQLCKHPSYGLACRPLFELFLIFVISEGSYPAVQGPAGFQRYVNDCPNNEAALTEVVGSLRGLILLLFITPLNSGCLGAGLCRRMVGDCGEGREAHELPFSRKPGHTQDEIEPPTPAFSGLLTDSVKWFRFSADESWKRS